MAEKLFLFKKILHIKNVKPQIPHKLHVNNSSQSKSSQTHTKNSISTAPTGSLSHSKFTPDKNHIDTCAHIE